MKETEKKLVSTTNARPGHYSDVISDIAEKKVCPFCKEQIMNFHKKPIVEKDHWLVTDNMYPYKPAKNHLLLIHKKHIEHVQDISTEAWRELKQIIDSSSKDRAISGGSLMMRFGESQYTGASVLHLHAHIYQSDPDSTDYNKKTGVFTRIG